MCKYLLVSHKQPLIHIPNFAGKNNHNFFFRSSLNGCRSQIARGMQELAVIDSNIDNP